jgi:hypothetical protein
MNTEQPNSLSGSGEAQAVQVQAPPKRALADVLWEAANVYLDPAGCAWGRSFSCHAVQSAMDGRVLDGDFLPAEEAMPWHFLSELGCAIDSAYQSPEWAEIYGREKQNVRYMWLLLAMHVAEDEGVVL